jgi:hypothetical protein
LAFFLFTGMLNPVIGFMQNIIYWIISLIVGLAR